MQMTGKTPMSETANAVADDVVDYRLEYRRSTLSSVKLLRRAADCIAKMCSPKDKAFALVMSETLRASANRFEAAAKTSWTHKRGPPRSF
jgi:hypothetical protein